MNLVYVGWNHAATPLDVRERLAFSPDRIREAMDGLFRENILLEGVIVSTCNRAEVYGLSEIEDSFDALAGFFERFHRVDGELLRRTALSGRGNDTVRHLFRVAAGLDSMVLGEAQILGQIREAHRVATANRSARAVTNRLFMSAVECGRRVRTETGLGLRPTSVPGVALTLAGRIFESLKGLRILLIGAGETVELTARLLVEEAPSDLLFCNRSPEKAAALAAASGGRTMPWDGRLEAFREVDIVLTATSAPEPIVEATALKKALAHHKRRGPLLVLDLAVPRDVDPAVDEIADLYRYDVDALSRLAEQNAKDRAAEVPRAEAIVEECVRKFDEWYGSLAQVDVVRSLRTKLNGLKDAELARFSGKLERLSAEDRELVVRISESLVNKILHEPTVGLKEGDAVERVERAAAIRALFKLDEKP